MKVLSQKKKPGGAWKAESTHPSERNQRFPVVLPQIRHSRSNGSIRLAHLTSEALFQGKWQIHVLCALLQGPIRIGQLGRLIPSVSKKVLTQSLRRLEAQGIVLRKDLSDLVLHVEYELHPELRESISELIDHLSEWGATLMASQEEKHPFRAAGESAGDPKLSHKTKV